MKTLHIYKQKYDNDQITPSDGVMVAGESKLPLNTYFLLLQTSVHALCAHKPHKTHLSYSSLFWTEFLGIPNILEAFFFEQLFSTILIVLFKFSEVYEGCLDFLS